MKQLYKFVADCGRQGTLYGVFAATKEEVKAAIGQHLYFGEVLGKHSEVEGKLEPNEVTAITDDQDFIAKAERMGLIPLGYNPLDYLPEKDC